MWERERVCVSERESVCVCVRCPDWWCCCTRSSFLSGRFRASPFESIIHTYVEIRCLGPGRSEKTNRGYDIFYGQVKARQESSSIKMKGCEWIWSISASAWCEVMKVYESEFTCRRSQKSFRITSWLFTVMKWSCVSDECSHLTHCYRHRVVKLYYCGSAGDHVDTVIIFIQSTAVLITLCQSEQTTHMLVFQMDRNTSGAQRTQ